MRLWSFAPGYLDRMGLLAVWREGLLAQKVLRGLTVGYRNHPQLDRFKAFDEPLAAIGFYLESIAATARFRNYSFDTGKIAVRNRSLKGAIEVSEGQLAYEWSRFLAKASLRDPQRFDELSGIATPETHPLFLAIPGGIATWERVS